MSTEEMDSKDDAAREFEEAAKARSNNVLLEFWEFLKGNKKWWLLPILIAVLGIGALLVLSSTAVAPFIYTLF